VLALAGAPPGVLYMLSSCVNRRKKKIKRGFDSTFRPDLIREEAITSKNQVYALMAIRGEVCYKVNKKGLQSKSETASLLIPKATGSYRKNSREAQTPMPPNPHHQFARADHRCTIPR